MVVFVVIFLFFGHLIGCNGLMVMLWLSLWSSALCFGHPWLYCTSGYVMVVVVVISPVFLYVFYHVKQIELVYWFLLV